MRSRRHWAQFSRTGIKGTLNLVKGRDRALDNKTEYRHQVRKHSGKEQFCEKTDFTAPVSQDQKHPHANKNQRSPQASLP